MSLFRPAVDAIEGYTPGEQPQEAGWIKLNTNENPYPPSPAVVKAIQAAASGRLNIYPDPLARRFREAAARLFDLDADWILPANGSDENLTILVRSFVDAGDVVSYPYPSYTLYETLADIQGAHHHRLDLNTDWSWNDASIVEATASKLVFVPNPNSPSGNRWSDEDVLSLVPRTGVLVLDEAYGDFADEPHRAELLQTEDVGRRIVVTRTLSKSYSLAGVRFGFAIAHPDLIRGMRKVKDSYNCNALSLAAATAAIKDQDWMRQNVERIKSTRGRLTAGLADLGFDVVPSQANFVWATRPDGGHQEIYESLKDRRILLRYMQFPDAEGVATIDGLRITVGTDDEIERFLTALEEVLVQRQRG